MPDLLKEFYQDEYTRETVLAYLIDQAGELAKERVLSRADTSGIADAVEVINLAFNNLEDTFAKKDKPSEPLNEAR